MRDHKINVLQNGVGGKGSKANKSKRKGFGYQILGFGSGGAGASPAVVDYLVVAGGGASMLSPGIPSSGGGGGAGGYRASGYGPSPLRGVIKN